MSFITNAYYDSTSYGYKDKDINGNSRKIPCGNVVKLEAIIESIEDGSTQIVLSFMFNGRWKRVTLARSILMQPELLTELANAGANISSTNTWCLVDTIRLQQQALEANGQVIRQFSKPGWFSQPRYATNGSITGYELCYRSQTLIGSSVPASYDGEYWFKSAGSFDVWRDMVINHVLNHPALTVVLLAGLSAVVNGLIAADTTGENPIFHLNYGSGTGKSTAGELAASTTGAPFSGARYGKDLLGDQKKYSSLYASWGATPNATIHRCTGNRGAVIVFNELSKFTGGDMSPIIYNLSEGTDKHRLTSDLKARQSDVYFTTIISIGESSVLERCKTKAEGLQVRVMEIQEPLTASAEHADLIKQVCRKNYGFAAPMLAQYILDNVGKEAVVAMYDTYRKTLRDKFSDNPQIERFIAKFPALILTTAELASSALGIPFDMEQITSFFIRYDQAHGTERNSAQAAYLTMIEECRVNCNTFISPDNPAPKQKANGKISYKKKRLPDGRYIVEEYSIRRTFLEEIFAKHGYDNKASCLRAWKDMGVLDHDKDRYTRTRKLLEDGGKEDVYVLKVFSDSPCYGPDNEDLVEAIPIQRKKKVLNKTRIADLLKDDEDEEGGGGEASPDNACLKDDNTTEAVEMKDEVRNNDTTAEDEEDEGSQWVEYCDFADYPDAP